MRTGESNAGHNRDKYNCTFPTLIDEWRAVWDANNDEMDGDKFPFGFVQLSTIRY